jgi:multidrug resistance efflux pump
MQIEHVTGKIGDKLPIEVNALNLVYERKRKRYVGRWVYFFLGILLIFLFLPWTQNIRSTGFVTTINQNERPQEVNSQIPGKILKWYVKEGDYVRRGDTLLQLGEVKDDYLDPQIIERTQQQIQQNDDKARFYDSKIGATEIQITTLGQQRDLKLQSLQNKRIQIDRKIAAKKAELDAAKVDERQSKEQIERAKKMFESEAISKFDLERRNATYQKAMAAVVEKQNDLDNLQQELLINRIEIDNTIQEYAEKIAKAQSDIFSSASLGAEAKEKVASLQIKKRNLEQRSDFYFLVAPQDGQVIQAKKAGINEIIKEGEMIVSIVPQEVNYAVELFVSPMDLPLVNIGQKVRFMFDGFPAIIFSGWPAASYGTFGGKVIAVETNRSVNGKFRLLVGEDSTDRKWPPGLKLGSGAIGFALLKDVPVWYELWRNINGFPPEFYSNGKEPGTTTATESKDK